jgi:hypothetical protein
LIRHLPGVAAAQSPAASRSATAEVFTLHLPAKLAAARIHADAAAVVVMPVDDGALRWSAKAASR